MEFYIEKEVFAKYPHLKVGVLVIKDADNSSSNEEIGALSQDVEKKCIKQYEGQAVTEIPKILDWREAYKAFGYKPSSNRPSVEALLRRVLQSKGLPDINPIVNLYNLISIKHCLPLGGDDLDKVQGPIRLSIAKGDEPFTMLGSLEKDTAKGGEIIYRDDVEVLCKAWNYRECDKSKVTEKSKNVALVIEGLEHTSLNEIKNALNELAKLISKQLNLTTSESILSIGNTQMIYMEKGKLKTYSDPRGEGTGKELRTNN